MVWRDMWDELRKNGFVSKGVNVCREIRTAVYRNCAKYRPAALHEIGECPVGGGRDGWMLTTQPLPDIYVASGGREEPLEA
jgi:hypothetical protein